MVEDAGQRLSQTNLASAAEHLPEPPEGGIRGLVF